MLLIKRWWLYWKDEFDINSVALFSLGIKQFIGYFIHISMYVFKKLRWTGYGDWLERPLRCLLIIRFKYKNELRVVDVNFTIPLYSFNRV